MAFRTGDIDELSAWSDEEQSDGLSYAASASPEEQRVGTHASFEQLLERELAKEQAQNGRSREEQQRPTGAKPRREFLRRGARGWWMENPNAKQKMQKHVLESVEVDENNQVGHAKAPPMSRAKSLPTRGRKSPGTSSVGTASPEPARKKDIAPVHISPVRRTSTPQPRREEHVDTRSEELRRSVPVWATNQPNVRTRESVETLTMSGVRHDFESRREQEANELADFEALEQELAAEKDSYLREKEEMVDRSTTNRYYGDDDDASWLRDSEDGASLQGESQHLLSDAFRSSYSNFDLGGESAMVFDGDHVFRSPMPRAPSVRANQGQRRSRPSLAPSDISAVSLNDSEPWGDANVLDHFLNFPASPIPKRGGNSTRLDDNHERKLDQYNGASRRESISSRHGTERRSNDLGFDDSSSYYGPYSDVDQRQREPANHGASRDAPVSSLVQQVFGGANQADEDWDTEQLPVLTEFSRTDSRRSIGKKKHSPKPPRSGIQARKAPRQSTSRDQSVNEDQPLRNSRRGVPALGSTVAMPVSIEEKVAELDAEVKFYKTEVRQLQQKKTQYDDEVQRLAQEKEKIHRYEAEQKQLIEQEWQRHRQKMKQEERMFERQMKLKLSAAASAGSRKDRAEIDALKAQIVALQLEAKQSSGKAKSTNDALRQRIAELEGKNRELSEEIKFLERDRLDQWQKYEDLLKEMKSQKQKQEDQRDQLKTVRDITRLSQSAEQLLSSLQFTTAENTRSRASEPSFSASSTPTYDRGGEYNPGRYRQARAGSAQSSQSSGKHDHDEDHQDGSFEASTKADAGPQGDRQVDEVVHPGGKREITYRDGTKRIFFADGNEKEILPNGDIVIRFTNGDRKEYFPSNGVSVYHYHEAQTKLTTYPDKTKVYEFPNQQIEKSYPDGTTEIHFADGITKTIHPSGDEFSKFPDGTTMLETEDGLREVTLLNGKKVRYYPDGKMTMVTLEGHESDIRTDDELRDLMETV